MFMVSWPYLDPIEFWFDPYGELENLKMVKYCFNIYDRETGEKVSQIVTSIDYMLDTLEILNELGMVKGYILDDKETENDN